MKIPKKIKVGGHTYRIKFVDKLLPSRSMKAETNHYKGLIEIDNDLGEEDIMEVFIHEVLHAIDHRYNNRNLTGDTVDAIGEGLFQVLSEMGIKLTKEG